MTAWEHYLRGMWHFHRLNPSDSEQAIACFRRAMAGDSGLADGFAGLARALFSRIAYGFPGDRDAMMREAAEAARAALALDSQMAQACYVLALVAAHTGDAEGGARHARRAVELNANFAGGHFALAVASSFSGRPREALAAIDMALRLNPHDPQRFAWLAQRASALYLDQRYAEAAETARQSLALRWYQTSSRVLAAALARLGETAAARGVAAELMASPIGEKSIAEAVRSFQREADRENYAIGLRQAGMPEG
jgi:adenylate cyclase